MIILHCLKEITWQKVKNNSYYGERYIELEGFIHCSDLHTFYKVAPNFKDMDEKLVLLCIESQKVEAQVKWEDGDNCGTAYPHIYGLLNINAVERVLPYLKDDAGNWIKNEELL